MDEPQARRLTTRRGTRAWALRRVGTVLLAAADERVRPGRRTIPDCADALDPRWLTAILCRDVPDAQVTAVTRVHASTGTTTRARVHVTYDDAGAAVGLPTALFAKWTASLAQRLMLGLGGFIDGEPGFYTEVRPRLSIEAPAGYFGAVDPRSWRSLVLVEDVVATRGARFATPATDVSPESLRALLAQTARWHGALWDSPDLARWRWLKTPAQQMHVIDSLIAFADRVPAGTRRAGDAIPAPLRTRARQADLRLAMRRASQRLTEGPHTYLHGDLHIANTYRTADGAMGVGDWQTSLRGCWAHDIAYLIATALGIEDRRAAETQLLDFYLDALAAAGGEVIPRAQAWDAYRQALFYPYFAWTYTLGRSRLQPRFQPDAVSLALVRRIATAIDDLDALAAVGL